MLNMTSLPAERPTRTHLIKKFLMLGMLAGSPVHATTCGQASWYKVGKKTASGETFHPEEYTAAHRTLPFGTRLHLEYNGKKLTVRINDRGPHIKNRILDLSSGAASALDLKQHGVGRICYSQR